MNAQLKKGKIVYTKTYRFAATHSTHNSNETSTGYLCVFNDVLESDVVLGGERVGERSLTLKLTSFKTVKSALASQLNRPSSIEMAVEILLSSECCTAAGSSSGLSKYFCMRCVDTHASISEVITFGNMLRGNRSTLKRAF